MKYILVLCTGNSARSILLESIFNTSAPSRVRAYSAGSRPSGKIHPQSLVLLAEKGVDTAPLRSKSWDEFEAGDAPVMDIVITVCGSAAGEECPVWPGAPVRAHWGVEDPAAAAEPDWEEAFTTAHNLLEKRAKALLDLPFEDLSPDALKTNLTQIGTLT